MIEASELTIRDWIEFLIPGVWEEGLPPIWPPDTFGIVASILQKTGVYCCILDPWPVTTSRPTEEKNAHRNRIKLIHKVAREWRKRLETLLESGGQQSLTQPEAEGLPSEVREWWNLILEHGDRQVQEISLTPKNRRDNQAREQFCQTLLQLCLAADEACAGLGIPGSSGIFSLQAIMRLISTSELPGGATLCVRIPRSRGRVLPKLHTPQSGLTIRSISHYLALCPTTEVEPNWHPTITGLNISRSMNILVVPWPREVAPSHFFAVGKPLSSPRHRLFSYSPPPQGQSEIVKLVPKLLKRAEAQVGRIDGVVFPELSLSEGQLDRIRKTVLERDAFLVAGVRKGTRRSSQPGKNYWVFNLPFLDDLCIELSQEKHHRWRLERRQIVQYGLGGRLHPGLFWWEHVEMQRRQIWFVGLRRWLTMCVLICEDLARQEPVTEIVRAVGPNLIISLLMDGPQLSSRWPGRYATVLAEDPGCSVLTLTSVGMAQLSRADDGKQGSRVVALWKDDKYGVQAIELPKGADGVVLSIVEEGKDEWTADGRKKDEKLSAYPTLNGIYPVGP